MAKIPAFVWLVLGAVVAFISYEVGPAFQWFLYLGLFFVAVGVVKLFFGRKTLGPIYPAHPVQRAHQHFCPRCRHPTHPTDRFCRNCGQRLR
jgi:hypothetical protein